MGRAGRWGAGGGGAADDPDGADDGGRDSVGGIAMAVVNRIAAFQDELTAWRRHLHAHPELGFEEHATAAFVAEKLREFGVDEIHTGLAGTGVVGVVRSGSGKRALAISSYIVA